jgi:hypothetical protein
MCRIFSPASGFFFLPPAGNFLPIAAERFTVVSAGFQPRCGMETGTLPRNRLALSATGGASAVSQRMPLETLGFKTSPFLCKSYFLNPAKTGNRLSPTHAAALLGG